MLSMFGSTRIRSSCERSFTSMSLQIMACRTARPPTWGTAWTETAGTPRKPYHRRSEGGGGTLTARTPSRARTSTVNSISVLDSAISAD